jgi:hypothetical protein
VDNEFVLLTRTFLVSRVTKFVEFMSTGACNPWLTTEPPKGPFSLVVEPLDGWPADPPAFVPAETVPTTTVPIGTVTTACAVLAEPTIELIDGLVAPVASL